MPHARPPGLLQDSPAAGAKGETDDKCHCQGLSLCGSNPAPLTPPLQALRMPPAVFSYFPPRASPGGSLAPAVWPSPTCCRRPCSQASRRLPAAPHQWGRCFPQYGAQDGVAWPRVNRWPFLLSCLPPRSWSRAALSQRPQQMPGHPSDSWFPGGFTPDTCCCWGLLPTSEHCSCWAPHRFAAGPILQSEAPLWVSPEIVPQPLQEPSGHPCESLS